jgi:hypothetical protein
LSVTSREIRGPTRARGWTVRGAPIKVFGSEINCPESAKSDGGWRDQIRQVPRQLRRGNEPVQLGGRALDILCFLASVSVSYRAAI